MAATGICITVARCIMAVARCIKAVTRCMYNTDKMYVWQSQDVCITVICLFIFA